MTCTELDVEKYVGRQTQEGFYLTRDRQKRVDHTGHKKTPTTRESPFIVHNTTLFILLSKSGHFVYSKINELLQRHLTRVHKTKRCLKVAFPPNPDRKGKRKGTTIREMVLSQSNV